MPKYVLSLDQGTTSSRAVLIDSELNIAGIAQKEISQIYPEEGWVEHDPMEIYASQYAVMSEVIARTGAQPSDIAAIGITNQRETTIMWDRQSGAPLYNAIVWQCRRTAPIVDDLVKNGMERYIKELTGLVPDAYFSGTKIKWILDNVPGAREKASRGDALFGTVDSWLIWKLTGGLAHVTDATNASRTMIFDIHKRRWDEAMLKALDIPRACLPEVRESSGIYGYVDIQGASVPIAGIAGDQQAALFGQCCFEAGESKNTYGTGCFLLMNTGEKAVTSKNGLITTIACDTDGHARYALEGSVFTAGAVVQWLRDELGLISESRDVEYFAGKVKDNGGVYLVPAFTGLGAPHWDMFARGVIVGLTRGVRREHILRAAEESIAYQSRDLVEAMEKDTGIKLSRLKVDGGACRDNLLMQFQADILDRVVERPTIQESTALGAGFLAGLAVGLWSGTGELKKHWRADSVFEADMDAPTRAKLLAGWQKAVGRSLGWARSE